MTWYVLDEISIRQLHHVLGARFLSLTTYVLSSRSYLITNFVETLNTANCKCILLSPYFNCHNPWISYLANQSSISKSLAFFSWQTFFIIFKVSLVRDGFLVGILNFFSCRFGFFSWFLFLICFFEADIGLDIIFSHFDFELINFFL